jgi:hypothetical protein
MYTQEKQEEDTRTKLEVSIRVCKHTMKSAVAMYALNPNVAEGICKVCCEFNMVMVV